MPDTVVVIDADAAARRAATAALQEAGCEVFAGATVAAGLEACARLRPDVIVVDPSVPDAAPDLVNRLSTDEAAVVPLLPAGDGDRGMEYARAGAELPLLRPVAPAALVAAVARGAARARLARYVAWLRAREGAPGRDLDALGGSPAMRHLAHQVQLLAAVDRAPVLIVGEPGTGKGWVARLVHALSPRARRPFIQAPGVGASAGVFEATLFGQDRPRRHGLVTVAEGGTLFLHEVGTLASDVQPRLLQLLEQGTYRRVGAEEDSAADVRLVAATAHDLVEATRASRLREDLYYRLSVSTLRLPPVRERAREDRQALITHLLADLAPRIAGAPTTAAPEVIDRLVAHPWPGNVRELRNVLERALFLARGDQMVGVEHLPGDLRPRGPGGERRTFQPQPLDDIERQHIERALRHFAGNRTRTAQALGISRATLINKIKRYSLDA